MTTHTQSLALVMPGVQQKHLVHRICLFYKSRIDTNPKIIATTPRTIYAIAMQKSDHVGTSVFSSFSASSGEKEKPLSLSNKFLSTESVP
mmetsp:Transcript_27175/g.57340  ORF Transcript_27175/g.57340 Transcript_27175/m.57340 type:complete len:90 (+) Transcript_27175:76-345(+)